MTTEAGTEAKAAVVLELARHWGGMLILAGVICLMAREARQAAVKLSDSLDRLNASVVEAKLCRCP